MTNPTTTNACFINNQWLAGTGPVLERRDPTEDRLTWQAPSASIDQVHQAVNAATRAAPAWLALSTDQRQRHLDAFGQALSKRSDDLLHALCLETGKPRWEARTELDALTKKIDLTRQAHKERQSPNVSTKDGLTSAIRYRPLGTVAVLGPFNLPAHLPNGQILPALLAGNTVIFKPSELTPLVGQIYTECMQQADLPPGVFNMIQGAREQGAALASHADINAVYFTGSRAGGTALSLALAPFPEKLLALEMGGNNPLIATQISNLDAAAYTIVQSAFITSGQRCTCARRLILLQSQEGDRLLDHLIHFTQKILVGPYTLSPEPFMGPVISPGAARALLNAQADLQKRGAHTILPLKSIGSQPTLLSPGILDVTAVPNRADEEHFGPLLQVIRVPTIDAALEEANRTRYGLAAGLLTDDRSLFDRFYSAVHAGIINWNKPTTGASGTMPFGGTGASGNHRPAGFFAIDFCADPVASLESPTLSMPATLLPGITT